MDDKSQLNFSEEMLVLDENGEFKILKNGQLSPYQLPVAKPELVREASVKPAAVMIATGQGRPALEPPPPATFKPTARFYFSPEDEEEVAKIKLPQTTPPGKKYSVDKILFKVIDNYKLQNLTEDLKLRLKNTIFSFLRDRRSLVDAQELLSRPVADAGLGFDQLFTERLIIFLKEVKEKIIQEKGLVVEEPPVQKELIKPTVKSIPPVASPFRLQPEVKPLPKADQSPAINQPKPVDLPAAKTYQDDVQRVIKQPIPLQRSIKEGKVAVADVKRDYRLIGPVEELASMSMVTLRRLGNDPATRAKKILDKIERLGKDSLTKKAAGIQAWRRSPLYKMYLAIGQASMEHSLSVKDIIDRYLAQGKEILTLSEFESISDLNKKLRF